MCTHEITAHFTVESMAQRWVFWLSWRWTGIFVVTILYPVANVHQTKLVVRTEFCFRCDIRKNPICWGENYDKENQVKHKKWPSGRYHLVALIVLVFRFKFENFCLQGINLIYAAGHCHAPACIRFDHLFIQASFLRHKNWLILIWSKLSW